MSMDKIDENECNLSKIKKKTGEAKKIERIILLCQEREGERERDR